MWKRFVNDYLSYSYKERSGIFILLGGIVLGIFVPFLYPLFIPEKNYDHRDFATEIAGLKLRESDSFSAKKNVFKKFDEDNFADYALPPEKNYTANPVAEVFYFDPNTASAAEWVRLGLKAKTIGTIKNYLSKGGHFYKAEDISKIWGLRAEEVKRLIPYVAIAPKKELTAGNHEAAYAGIKKVVYAPKTLQPLDINLADTTAFIALPGIGSKLAQRIVNFRDKLGGFYAIDQMGETFGLPDSTFQKLKPSLRLANSSVQKIDLNAVLLEKLKMHPYVRYAMANAIIQYRTSHGNFAAVADVKKIMLVTDEVYNKMAPYLTVTQ